MKVVPKSQGLVSGGQMAERLGNWATNQKIAGLIPGRAIDVVSRGKALHPICLGENVLTVSRSG